MNSNMFNHGMYSYAWLLGCEFSGFQCFHTGDKLVVIRHA